MKLILGFPFKLFVYRFVNRVCYRFEGTDPSVFIYQCHVFLPGNTISLYPVWSSDPTCFCWYFWRARVLLAHQLLADHGTP